MPTSISFAGNSLQTSSIQTADIDHHDIPTKDAKFYPLAHAMGSAVPFVNYPSRMIKISGLLDANGSVTAMDALLDTFKGYLVGTSQNLDIGYNGGTRRYIATVTKTAISRPVGLGYARFEVTFECTNPFGLDATTTSALSASGRTANAYTDNYTFLGTAPYQYAVFTYTLTAVTGGTSATLSWGNGNNGQVISITRTWAASDVVVIDCLNKTVTVNGAAVAFTGAFPEFPPGAQTMQYNDGFTTRTFTVAVVYTVGWL